MESTSYNISDLNWDHLRRNFAFKSGDLKLSEELMEGLAPKKGNKNLRGFTDLPCILPV